MKKLWIYMNLYEFISTMLELYLSIFLGGNNSWFVAWWFGIPSILRKPGFAEHHIFVLIHQISHGELVGKMFTLYGPLIRKSK